MTAIKPTIFLVKEDIKNPRSIFKKSRQLHSIQQDEGILFYKRSVKNTPDWAYFVNENFNTPITLFINSHAYAVLVMKIEDRMLAVPFGMGMHLLDMTKFDLNFGLKTAINCIPKNQIRQIDTTTPEINSQKTKKLAVVGSTPEEFGINKQKDILRGIVGKLPSNHYLGEAIEGKDSLRITKNIESLSKLKTLCKKVLKIYASDTYKADYPWIDNIALVRDKILIEKLTKQLIGRLKAAKFENMLFSPPLYYENIFDCNGFAFSSGDRTHLKNKDFYEMPSMSDWKKSIGERRKEMSMENIDRFRVNLVDKDGQRDYSWTLQRCLSWEVEFAGNKYVLSEGNWYSVAVDFFSSVNRFYLTKVLDPNNFPRPSKAKIKESDYNKELTDTIPNCYLFDLGHNLSANKSIGKDKNEVCDIYDAHNRSFIHVKMGKSSPSISHLLRQGAYSGLVLKQDETIRKEFIKHLVDYGCQQDILKEPFAPQDYRIVFAIVIGKKQKKDIPFFSKVSLRDVLENILELMGYQCNFTYIVKP